MHAEIIGRLYRPKRKQHDLCLIMNMRINGATTIFDLAKCFIKARCGG
jgi:hypothetical protein